MRQHTPGAAAALLCAALLLSSVPLPGAEPVRKTIAQFRSMSRSDTTLCELEGVVKRIRSVDFNRLVIEDGTGSVLIYGFSDGRGRGIRALDIRKGDTLTLRGRRYVYDRRVIEMKGARCVSHSKGPDHDKVHLADEPDTFPSFKGTEGPGAFMDWVASNLPGAPGGGEAVVSFVVGTDGRVQEVYAERGSSPSLKGEAERVIRKSPRWKPALNDGRAVRYKYTVTVVFPPDSTAGR